jgi:uncharacterized protein YgbK (DUF1537 family)
VEVALEATYQSDAQALIYNSDSRAMTATAAYEKVAALTESVLRQSSPAWLVKKIDSTLRGNPGAEVMAMQQVTGAAAVIIAPAFPAAGRITREGKCLVNGVLLTDTEFASDPKTPITRADVGALFSGHSQNITLAVARRALAVRKHLRCWWWMRKRTPIWMTSSPMPCRRAKGRCWSVPPGCVMPCHAVWRRKNRRCWRLSAQ